MTMSLRIRFSESLSVVHGYLMHGNRVVISTTMRSKILDILHKGHFSMQHIKQLARLSVSVYWPNIVFFILCYLCYFVLFVGSTKINFPANHPWMLPEKPFSCVHVDHASNFMGHKWLIITDLYSKYPIIHQTSSTSTLTTTCLLDEDFARFGYHHAIVSDNATI